MFFSLNEIKEIFKKLFFVLYHLLAKFDIELNILKKNKGCEISKLSVAGSFLFSSLLLSKILSSYVHRQFFTRLSGF